MITWSQVTKHVIIYLGWDGFIGGQVSDKNFIWIIATAELSWTWRYLDSLYTTYLFP